MPSSFFVSCPDTVQAPADGEQVREDFRLAMRRMAAAVAIVTCRKGDEWLGITATSMTSLSMDPPSLLLCVNRSASIRAALEPGAAFTANLLERRHKAVSDAFGGRASGTERFGFGDWGTCERGVPVLRDAIAAIQCKVDREVEYGTHTIIIGKVLNTCLSDELDPLVYVNGNYQ